MKISRSSAGAAGGSAGEIPPGPARRVVAAAAGPASCETGERRREGGRSFESGSPEAGEGGDGSPSFGSGFIRGGGGRLRPGSLSRHRGLPRGRRRRRKRFAEVAVDQGVGHPRIVAVGAMDSSPRRKCSQNLLFNHRQTTKNITAQKLNCKNK